MKEAVVRNSIKSLLLLFILFQADKSLSQNIVRNSSFANGISNWSFNSANITNYYGNKDSKSVSIGCVGHGCVSQYNSGSYFQQDLITNSGTFYDISFYVSEFKGPTSELSVFWNGNIVADVVNPANYSYGSFDSFKKFQFSGFKALGTLTNLQIHGRSDTSTILFDDISVTPSSIPDIKTWAMMLLGFSMICVYIRKNHISINLKSVI